MEQEMQLYYSLQEMVKSINDKNVLAEADRQLKLVEDRHPELIRSMMGYVPAIEEEQAHDDSFTACVLGSEGHALVHLLEYLYPNANIIWVTNSKTNVEEYSLAIDWLFVAESVVKEEGFLKSTLKHWSCAVKTYGKCCFIYDKAKRDQDFYCQINIAGFRIKNAYTNDLVTIENIDTSREGEKKPSRFRKIYVACLGSMKTGGPELMHQLVQRLNTLYGNAEIVYMNPQREYRCCHPEFLHYVAGHITSLEGIEDQQGNVMIVPEIWSTACDMNWQMDLYFWWLSVDNFVAPLKKAFEDTADDRFLPEKYIEGMQKTVKLHMVQSEYARDYIMRNGVPAEKICHLGDYVSQQYLDQEQMAGCRKKEDIVLYNPKKGKAFVEKLVELAPDIRWTPIQNMTTEQVVELLQRSKVYIDFGDHPGKDRLPREAAISGCVVITGKRGSAAFQEDVSIPEKYKLSEECNTYEDVIEMIYKCLADYNVCTLEFEEYRAKIRTEKQEFFREIEEIFGGINGAGLY